MVVSVPTKKNYSYNINQNLNQPSSIAVESGVKRVVMFAVVADEFVIVVAIV